MKHFLFIFTFGFLISGCNTMHFTKTNKKTIEYTNEIFHHIGIFSLVEFSKPVRPAYQCENKRWSSVRTRNSFLSGLVSSLASPLYSPKSVSFSCKN